MFRITEITFLLLIHNGVCMDLIALADSLAELRRRVAEALIDAHVDVETKNAMEFVDHRLMDMERECRHGDLRPLKERWPELTRVVEEADPCLLPPELGGELIEAEQQYRHAQ